MYLKDFVILPKFEIKKLHFMDSFIDIVTYRSLKSDMRGLDTYNVSQLLLESNERQFRLEGR